MSSSQEKESQPSTNDIKKILIFMKHGEKLIKTGVPPKCGKFDSELTSLGIDQSFRAGQKLLDQLKKYHLENISPSEIHIISSPFMRTLQTTAHYLRGIMEHKNFFGDSPKIEDLYNISIDYDIREIISGHKLKGEGVPKDYLNFLFNPKYKDFDEELKKLNTNVVSKYEYPVGIERGGEYSKRCARFVDEQLTTFDKNNNYKVIVVVSHAGPLQALMKKVGLKIRDYHEIIVSQQYFFDISDGVENAKFLEKVGSDWNDWN